MADITSLFANIATAFGIPIAIIAFLIDRRRDRRDRELDTYRALSDKYFEYLQMVFDNPGLSTTEIEWSKARDPNRDPRQDLLVQMAVNLIETAFFLYRGHRSEFRQIQWDGWHAYLQDWCAHPAFVARWPDVIEQYDAEFCKLVREVYQEVHGARPPNQALQTDDRRAAVVTERENDSRAARG